MLTEDPYQGKGLRRYGDSTG